MKSINRADAFLSNFKSRFVFELNIYPLYIKKCSFVLLENDGLKIQFFYSTSVYCFVKDEIEADLLNLSRREIKGDYSSLEVEILSENDYAVMHPQTDIDIEIEDISIKELCLPDDLTALLNYCWDELRKCYKAKAYFATMFLLGSFLEGVLLGILKKYPKQANLAKSAPTRKDGNVKNFGDWILREMISVAYDMGCISYYTKNISDNLRDFRNMIHLHKVLNADSQTPEIDTCKTLITHMQGTCNEIIEWIRKSKEKQIV